MQTYDLSAVTVLIVDPNAFMREILRELLDGLGVGRILTARSLENAADRLREEPRIDMILTELDLDQQDGVDLIKAIRNHRDRAVERPGILHAHPRGQHAAVRAAKADDR